MSRGTYDMGASDRTTGMGVDPEYKNDKDYMRGFNGVGGAPKQFSSDFYSTDPSSNINPDYDPAAAQRWQQQEEAFRKRNEEPRPEGYSVRDDGAKFYQHDPDYYRQVTSSRGDQTMNKFDGLRGIGDARAAQMEWALKPQDGTKAVEQYIGSTHPSIAAHKAVREVLGQLSFPMGWDARYLGVKRASGTGSFGVEDGVINMQVEFKSRLGARHHIEVPVFVRAGRALAPAVLMHNGRIRTITQHAIDDIVKAAELTKPVLDRKMFSPPSDQRGAPRRTPIIQKDMFHNASRGPRTEHERIELQAMLKLAQLHGDHEREAQLKKMLAPALAPALLAGGMGVAGPAMAGEPGPYEYGGQKDPVEQSAAEGAKYEFGGQGDEMFERRLQAIAQEQQALMQKYAKDPRLMEVFKSATMTALDGKPEELAAAKAAVVQEHGAVSGAVDAFNDGVKLGGLFQEKGKIEMKMGKSGSVGHLAMSEGSTMEVLHGHMGLGRALERVANRKQAAAEGKGYPRDSEWGIDEAEREQPTWGPGKDVKLKSTLRVPARDGVSYVLPKGAKGKVRRDITGTGDMYLVWFPELFESFKVPRSALA